MKKPFGIMAAFIGVVAALCVYIALNPQKKQGPSDGKLRVYINQIVEHPALDTTVKGIIDALEEGGYKRDEKLDVRVESAQTKQVLAAQISSKFVGMAPEFVVGVGTVSAQSLSKYAIAGKVKMMFSSITDPVSAGLVKSIESPENNTSGVSNFVDLKPQIELFKKIQPELRKLGILYNPTEVNSVSIVKKLEIVCKEMGIDLIKQTVNSTADLMQNTTKLAKECDAIFVSNDNTALSGISGIAKIATEAGIPVYVSDTDAVELGAVAALGPNQYNVGRQTGEMILRIQKGDDINKAPVEFPAKTELYLNLQAAEKIGIKIPRDIKKSAAKIIKTKE